MSARRASRAVAASRIARARGRPTYRSRTGGSEGPPAEAPEGLRGEGAHVGRGPDPVEDGEGLEVLRPRVVPDRVDVVRRVRAALELPREGEPPVLEDVREARREVHEFRLPGLERVDGGG